MKKRLSAAELIASTAIVAILATILFPVAQYQVAKSRQDSGIDRVKKIALAATLYSADYDDMLLISFDGGWGEVTNSHNKAAAGTESFHPSRQRTDVWPLILSPYLTSISVFVDPSRGDAHGIYTGAALGNFPTPEAGFDRLKNTYRNQNRLSMFGYNYIYLSPHRQQEPQDMAETSPIGAEARSRAQAVDPAKTIAFTAARYWNDTTRGHSFVNAPGMWDFIAPESLPYTMSWNGQNCSGDWCGANPDTNMRTSNFYEAPGGSPVVYLDGHAESKTAADVAAGTNWSTIAPGGYMENGGVRITNKAAYRWNLDDNYYGAAE